MPFGMDFSFGSSVIKREAKPVGDVVTLLKRRGWEETGRVSDRIVYLSNSGMSITVIGGPVGTTIMPSGPVRGALFGDVDFFSRTSVIGAGKKPTSEKKTKPQSSSRSGKRTIN